MEKFVCGDMFVINDSKTIEQIQKKLEDMGLKFSYHIYDGKISLFYFLGYTKSRVASDFYTILVEGVADKIEKINLSIDMDGKDVEILEGDWRSLEQGDKVISLDILPTYGFEFIQEVVLKNMLGKKKYKFVIKRYSIEDRHLGKNLLRLDIVL